MYSKDVTPVKQVAQSRMIFSFCLLQDYEESKRRKVISESCSAARNLDLEHSTGTSKGQEPLQSEITKRFDSVLRSQLVHWTGKLLKLQPKVHMSPHIMECGLCLFKRLRQKQLLSWADGKLPKAYISNRELMIHDLIACWWIAMKHCSIRTAVPNRTLLSRATDAKDLLLADCEMAALIALDWNVNSLLAEEGLVKC
jgi:hypothetical protein